MTSQTVERLLRSAAAFPAPGEPPRQVGDRWYPRYASDDVPRIIGECVEAMCERPDDYGIELGSCSGRDRTYALACLRDAAWPSRLETDTMHKHAAKFVEDFAREQDLKLPELD